MKIRSYVVVAALTALCFFNTKEVSAQSTKIKVAVEVFFSGDNASNLETSVADFVKKDLRSYKDIELVDENEDFKFIAVNPLDQRAIYYRAPAATDWIVVHERQVHDV